MSQRGQNAVEFLSVYSFAIVIMTIVIALVLILSTTSTSVIPQECSFFGGFSCTDVAYATWNGVGSQIFLITTFAQPGVVNVSSFNVIISGGASTNGVCTPNVASEGEAVYCTASFGFVPKIGNTYTGTFTISAEYCARPSSSLYNYSCPANGNYIYAGNLQLQAEARQLPQAPYYYAPVTVSNTNATTATQGGLQIMTTFVPSAFSPYESANLGNVRFYDGAKELYSWCETNCASNSTGTAVFWVALDRGIGPGGYATLSMYFLPNNIGYDGVYAGESPLQSNTYARYDNGANVFSFYDNFAGTALNSSRWSGCASVSCIVNNGIKIQAPSTETVLSASSKGSFGRGIVDFYGVIPPGSGGTYCLAGVGLANSQNVNDSTAIVYVCGSSYGLQTSDNQSITRRVAGLSLGSNTLYSVILPSSSPKSVSAMTNYGNTITSTAALPALPQPVTLLNEINSGLTIGPIYYIRVRDYPPGGILLPTATGNALLVP